MILSKSIMHTRNAFLVNLKSYKVKSSSIHLLQSSSNVKYRILNAVIAPEVCHIISRLESLEAASGKDKILHLSKDIPHAPISVNANSAQNVVGNDLADIPVPGESIVAASELPDIIADAVVPLNKLGEPTLQSLGIGNAFTPVGWVQRTLEFVHVTFNIPWWASISICVIIIRLIMFPLVISTQRSSTKMHNIMPRMQEIQLRMQHAKTYGNHVEAMKCGNELATFMKENSLKPIETMLLPMLQAPVFISFFLGLRKMAIVPVESMTRGGTFWFTDLTVMDEFYLLPLITCVTLWITLEVGADFSKMPSASILSRYMPYAIKIIPIVVFPVIMHYPAAICVYWGSTNMMSLIQVAFLKIPAVRMYFGIDRKMKHDPSVLPIKKKGIVKDFKSAYSNVRIAKEIQERERLDELNFKRAGRAPPAKTYKYNPTINQSAVQAKKG